jgi:hypothetical protein
VLLPSRLVEGGSDLCAPLEVLFEPIWNRMGVLSAIFTFDDTEFWFLDFRSFEDISSSNILGHHVILHNFTIGVTNNEFAILIRLDIRVLRTVHSILC